MSVYIDQNRFTFRIVTAIYCLPVSHDQTVNRFVEKRSSLASFGLGLVLALVCLYHDFFMQNRFFNDLSPFSFAIVVSELFLITAIPICIVLNNFMHRKRITELMNTVFVNDSVLDASGVALGRTCYRYLRLIILLVVTFQMCKLWKEDNMEHKMLTTTFAIRYVLIVEYLYLYHLCVSMIRLRMQQLEILYYQKQHEHELEQFLCMFVERFERYVRQIAQINRCFSLPIVGILMLGMVELVYFAYECFNMVRVGLSEIDMYSDLADWILSQFWQAMYFNMILLIVPTCARARKKVEETALCTRHFDDYRLQNTRAAKQIQKFLLKNLHQKKKFSACGFFDIDNTVIYMVFSSIVTYLVILIQFKQLETDLTQSEGVFNVTSNLTTPGPS
uniref:Gustatory receptor n=1 Tax=Anopheles dirus TaxID=7168 RepID=A0A182NBX7_9DIPT